MSDIRTIDFIDVNEQYRVAIAESGDEFEASVVATHDSAITQMMKQAFSLGDDTSEWTEIDDAPRVYAKQKYVAIGEAIEAFLDDYCTDESDE